MYSSFFFFSLAKKIQHISTFPFKWITTIYCSLPIFQGQYVQQYDNFPLTIRVTEGCIANRTLLLSPWSFLSQVIFFDNFNQQLILPLDYGELLVRSYASVTIDTPQSVHRNWGIGTIVVWFWETVPSPIESCNINTSRPSLLNYTFLPHGLSEREFHSNLIIGNIFLYFELRRPCWIHSWF